MNRDTSAQTAVDQCVIPVFVTPDNSTDTYQICRALKEYYPDLGVIFVPIAPPAGQNTS